MTIEKLSGEKPAILGLLQATIGFLYISFMATFFQLMERSDFDAPEFFAALVMLTLFAVSATIMGLTFLGVPIYLAMKGNWTKGFKIVGFTLLFSGVIIAALLTVIFVVFS